MKKLRKNFPANITTKQELREAINDYPLNLCKGIASLKRDKELIVNAIRKDPFAIVYVDEDIRQSKDIQRIVQSESKYLNKWVDPITKEIGLSKPEIDEETINLVCLTNEKRLSFDDDEREPDYLDFSR